MSVGVERTIDVGRLQWGYTRKAIGALNNWWVTQDNSIDPTIVP